MNCRKFFDCLDRIMKNIIREESTAECGFYEGQETFEIRMSFAGKPDKNPQCTFKSYSG
jgi:hypothetical protein